ncbi:MAG TPA: chemotaxis protein CheB [Phycisphaerae bacterium]|nr:chemotaxis protein CheB [Phycisphaerae bacterium]
MGIEQVKRESGGNGDGAEESVQEEGPDRLAEPTGAEARPRLPFPVVGVGASAGGLEAYTEFLQACEADSGMAFVLIQHLSPKHQSMLAELLGKQTKMPVLQVEDGMEVKPNHVYVIRPGFTMTIREGRLHLGESAAERMHRRPIDDFFKSLAEEQRERAVAVVLSGTGSNGTLGCESIKAVGGFCIAEDPQTAKYPSMPRSVIDSHLADAILQPKEMFGAIKNYAGHPYTTGEEAPAEVIAQRERRALGEVIAVLRARTRHDFSVYKKPTLIRRIQRRMSLMQIGTMSEYVRNLRQTPSEITALSDDLMIHVTGFFRDAEVWESLRKKVIEPMVAEKPEDSPIRCWVTACSSGEEAYTIGMLLLEAAEEAGKRFDIKIFATDTAERSLGQARSGTFPGGIESEITPERLARFFDKDDSFYRVKKELRELVVFAPQNVLQDPPFSRLDVCTCRNLLIYIEGETQRRILTMLHFGLREGGALVLGTSETITGAEDLFEPLDKVHRIYRRMGPSRHGALDFPIPQVPMSRRAAAQLSGGLAEHELQRAPRASISQLATKTLLDQYTPAAVVVDRGGQIVYFHGQTKVFLDQPVGEPTREVLALAREEIRGTVRSALQKAMSENALVRLRNGTIGEGTERRRVEVTAAPLEGMAGSNYYLVSFQQYLDPPPAATGDGEGQAREVNEELARVRDELQSTIEELQTSNEEMKASHEEVTSINEELQSTNEELETSKEELQSLNEELSTVNSQLQAKMEELERTTNDLGSLLSSTDIAVIFLDTQFRIRRYTPAARELVELIPSDVGRPLKDLAWKFDDATLMADAPAVLERLVPVERELPARNGRWYMRRVLPYRTGDNRIDGVVVTFIDVTQRRKSEEALRASEERFRRMLNVDAVGVLFFSAQGRITDANGTFERMSGYTAEELRGVGDWMALTPPEYQELTRRAARELAERGKTAPYEKEMVRKDGSRWRMLLAPARLEGAEGSLGWVEFIIDLTDIEDLSDGALRGAKEAAEAANRMKDDFLATLSHELRTPLSAILIYSNLLRRQAQGHPEFVDGLEAMVRSAEAQKQLIDDLLDSARITSGKLRLQMRTTDLGGLVEESVEAIRPTAEAKGVALKAKVARNLGTVSVDPDRLQQVVWNLLNNAVKFTPKGGKVEMHASRQGDEVQIEVSDTGRGIEAEFLPEVFEPFRQADASSTRIHGGLGLGLAICKRLVEQHGGTIRAESGGAGRGATFTVLLPLPALGRRDGGSGDREGGSRERAGDLRGLKILAVEDDPETRGAIVSLLTRGGAEVHAAGCAQEALEAFKQSRPDLLVCDIGMAEEDGYSLMRKIRALEASTGSAAVRSAALTAFVRDEDRRKALAAGFNRHIAKPVDPDELVAALVALAGERAL